MDNIIDYIASALEFVVDFIIEVVDSIIDFWNDVVEYFKKLKLRSGVDNPFLVDPKKFKDILKDAPTETVGIFSGSYNEETDQIEHGRYLTGEDLDEKTKEVLGDRGIVVLK